MADAGTAAPPTRPRKRRLWLRVLGWAFAVFLLLLVVLYSVAASSAFFQRTILPRVSNSLHATVTVSSAEIRPFSRIILHDLRIEITNQPPLLTAPEVRIQYSLLDIIGGNIHVDELALESPIVQIVQNADGSSNLEQLIEAQKKAAVQTRALAARPGGPSRPQRIELRKLSLSNGTILKFQYHKAGTRDLLEVTNVDISASNLKNGGSGKIQFSALIRDENNPPAPALYGLLQASVNGSFDFSLAPDLRPATVLGDAHLNISQAGGSFADFAKLAGALHCDVLPTEIRTVSLSFEKNNRPLGELRAEGPYDARKSEGRLTVELLSVDKQVLNLFAARSGIDFGSTTITSTNQIQLTKSKASIAIAGQLNASKFQLSRTNESTPPIELRADYDVSIDNSKQSALLQALSLFGSQNGRPLLRGELTSPMTLAWGNVTNTVSDSSFDLAVSRLNISDWKVFLGGIASEGLVDLDVRVFSSQAGKRLIFDGTNWTENLTFQAGPQRISDATVMLQARGTITNFEQLSLSDCTLQVVQSNLTALTLSGSGTYNMESTNADLNITLDTTLARAQGLFNRPELTASSGAAELKAHISQKQQTQTLTGNLAVNKFTGKIGNSEFRNFGVTIDLDAARNPQQLEIHKAAGKLTVARNQGGDFEMSGIYSVTKPSQLTLRLADFNQDGLRPFLEPLLADKKLVSGSISGTASVQRKPNGDSSAKADFRLSNLVMSSPTQQLPTTPLEAQVHLDADKVKQVADIRQFQITLTPTERANNQFQIQGQLDLSKSNATQGSLKLTADSLDLTRYYDLFIATNKPVAKPGWRNKSQSPVPPAPASPPPVVTPVTTNELPFRNFTVDANVREFYLRDIAATNFQMTLKADGSRVVLKPFQLTLSGSPIFATADVDMSVPGYKYAFTFNTTNVPFAPLWNTFHPDEKGKMGGTLTADVNLSGTGTSGETLQETLTGNFDVSTTNLNLDVSKIRNPILADVVAVVAKVPELFGDNPISAAEDLMKGAGGRVQGKYNGGMSSDVSKSPIEIVAFQGSAGQGRVSIAQAVAQSSAFKAEVANGTIKLAPELTNSTLNLPVSIHLSAPIVQRIPVLAALASANSNYVKLPDFYVEKGTLANPKPGISAAALGKDVIQRILSDFGTGTNSIVSAPLNTIRGLVPGDSNTNLNTNRPGTNQSPVANLPHQFNGARSGGK